MNNEVDLAVALDLVERKIAKLSIKMAKEPDEETQNQLNEYLKLKKEIFNGNTLVIKQIIDN